MYAGETSTSNTKKHHRIHPIADHNSPTNDNQKNHTIVNLASNDDDTTANHHRNQRTNSQTSNSSSSVDVRASDVIKRITSPSATMSNTDEILPQTFFRRMSVNFNMNSLVPATTTTAASSVLPAIHDVHSANLTEENYTQSMITTVTNLYNNTTECEICYSSNECENLQMCKHHFCSSCLQIYLIDKIRNGCPALLECPHNDCKQVMHPNDIKRLLNDDQMYERYETFMLRRVLQKMPDTRWCPYPNCDFAVLVENARKASKYDCPLCQRPFCQRCSQIWHPNLTCDRASAQRAAQDPTLEMLMKSSSNEGSIRPCPRCKSPIEKLNDGSCNHIRCAICTCEFCWLCMKEVDNLHFITPTGCTFYGKKRWTNKKSILFLILSWIITPILAILLIVIAIPILLIVLPIMMTRKFYQHSVEIQLGSTRSVILCIFVFISTFILTPLILLLALIIGIPLLIFFIYFYMPRRFITANF